MTAKRPALTAAHAPVAATNPRPAARQPTVAAAETAAQAGHVRKGRKPRAAPLEPARLLSWKAVKGPTRPVTPPARLA